MPTSRDRPVALAGGHDGADVAVQCMVADALWQAALHQPDHNQRHSDREQRGRQEQQPQGNDSDDEEPQRQQAQQAWGWVPGKCARFIGPGSTGAKVLSCPEGLLDGVPAVKCRPRIQMMQALGRPPCRPACVTCHDPGQAKAAALKSSCFETMRTRDSIISREVSDSLHAQTCRSYSRV